ncbi:outer membrane protein assembly factor BamB family protein, partial [Actinoplanes awajinensis]
PHQQWPVQPQPPARSAGRGPLLAGLIVLLVLVAGAAFIWRNRSGGVDPKPTAAVATDGPLTVAWSKTTAEDRLPQDGAAEEATSFATWVTDDLVVRVSLGGVAAYRLADGTRAWATEVPAGSPVCTASHDPAAGFGVIAFGTAEDQVKNGTGCAQIGVIDLATGTMTHTVPVQKTAGTRSILAGVRVIAGGSVAVYDDQSAVTAVDLASGRRLWRLPTAKYCTDEVFAMTDKRIVMESECFLDRKHDIVILDPVTGKQVSATPMGEDLFSVLNVVSADPVVVVALSKGGGSVLITDAAGKKVATVPAKATGWDLDLIGTSRPSIRGGIDQPAMVAHGGVLYAGNRTGNQVIAFDLKDGHKLWDEQGNLGDPALIRADDDGLLVLESKLLEASLVRLDPRSGQVTALREGKVTREWVSVRSTAIVEHRGQLVLTPTYRTTVLPSVVVLR